MSTVAILSYIAFSFLILGILVEFYQNFIYLPMHINLSNREFRPMPTPEEFRIYTPPFLREHPFIDLMIGFGGIPYWVICSIFFIITRYLINQSILSTILYIPGLIFVFFILKIFQFKLSMYAIKKKMQKYQ